MKIGGLIVLAVVALTFLNAEDITLSKASSKVEALIKKGDFKIVDTNYFKSKLGKGTRVGAKVILIDARPKKKYQKGHIPTAINIPDTAFDKFYPQISSMDKNREIITYCGGWKCIKSPKVALDLKRMGWQNIKIYQAGMPKWTKDKNYIELNLVVVKSMVKKKKGFIIDARPQKVYKKGHIPTAINIPDTKFNEYKNLLPKDKSIKIVTYCGGYKCAKSHNVAKELIKLGYEKVSVFAGGLPLWQKKGLEIEKDLKNRAKEVKKTDFIIKNGVKLVAEQEDNEGMVYAEFFKEVADGKIKDIVIVDVRDKDEFGAGHIKNAVNIPISKFKEKNFVEEVEKIVKGGKKVILVCATGGRATEAMTTIIDNKGDLNNIFFADANIDCDKNGKCKIEVNEPL